MRVQYETPDISRLRENNFIVDMHFHTKYSFDCATSVETIVKRARLLNVHMAITDHNRIAGMVAAHKLAPDLIYPGIEICTAEGKEVIPYFYNVAELEEFFRTKIYSRIRTKTSLQSNATSIPTEELLDLLKHENCVVSLPHPFAIQPRRSFSFYDSPKRTPLLRNIHAVEVLNATMMHRHNLASAGWALKHDKAMIGGSDGHDIWALGNVFTYAPVDTWEEFLDAIKKKQTSVVGIEHKFGYKMVLASNILRQKARLIKNITVHKKL